MSIRRLFLFLLVSISLLIATGIPIKSNNSNGDSNPVLIVGRNVNMVAGQDEIDGDPFLQRQNEPSIAVSTRNPMHLLAAANDYRTVEVPFPEGPLPGIEMAASADGDAWMGIFKSYNGGQSWTSTLLPGYPQEEMGSEGTASPLYGYSTACDPTVRAGSSGLFFTSGIVFDRTEHGGSAIFVARYIDNNTQAIGEMDSIEYIDVNIIDEGTSGQFADKPWIAVAAPTSGTDTVPIDAPGYWQRIPRFDVYMVYSIFLGSEQGGGGSKIMFAKSSDCGNTWGRPFKLSESVHVCQGTNIVVSPAEDGTIYVVWRQYAREQQGVPDAIVMCKSDDRGQTFTKAKVIAEIDPYDQWTYSAGPEFPESYRFRTSAFPAIAVDHNGLVYVAWSQLGVGEGTLAEVPRIVIRTTKDGKKWSDPTPIDKYPKLTDEYQGRGHQIMPSLTYAGGKLIATWYDTRNSPSNVLPEISGELQTMDVRAAQANPSDSHGILANPYFGDSVQVSRYLYTALTDEATGDLLLPPVIYQDQFNHPNFPLFDGGNSPFMGDYLDSAPSLMFLYDYERGNWRFNAGEGALNPALSHIVFACNRDVVPPPPPIDWGFYWPPGSDDCKKGITAGIRNQNIYTAPVTQGIQVGCPVNTKPLSLERSSFLVFVRNLTDFPKDIRLTIDADPYMNASFWEFGPPQEPETSEEEPPEECPFPFDCADRIVELPVLPHSSVTLTVFVWDYHGLEPTLRINVEEIDDYGELTGLKSAVILNPDPVNTGLIDPAKVLELEYEAMFVITEDLAPVDFDDATVFSAEVVYSPEVLDELLESSNPDILSPTRRHPTRRHDALINPTFRHSSIGTASEAPVTDVSWSVENKGTATSAYSFELLGETPSVPYQLLIYRVTSTPVSDECILSAEEHHELLLSFENPTPLAPTRRHESLRNPTRRHNTFFLAPGETAICTLRLIDYDPSQESGGSTQEAAIMSNGETQEDFNPVDYATTIAGVAIPQAANADGIIELATSLYIVADPLSAGSVGESYTFTFEAYGGETDIYEDPNNTPDDPFDDIWKYDEWSLMLQPGESFPPGLSLSQYGIISETPQYDSSATYPQDYFFTVQVKDISDPQQVARRRFNITIGCNVSITPKANDGGAIYFDGAPVTNDVIVNCGDSPTFTIVPDHCFHVLDVFVDGVSVLPLPIESEYTFTKINQQDHTIDAVFERDTFIITATAGVGGSIDPAGAEIADCGLPKTFTITVDEGYMLDDVVVDKNTSGEIHLGPKTTHTFTDVQADHTIEAIFKKLEKWDQRYDYANGADGANDIGVDPSGNVYVTGYSSNGTDNDYATINYRSDGTPNANWGTNGALRYDGGYGNDEASALALDNLGNVYVTGFSFSRNKGEDFYTISYDSAGAEHSSARYDGPAHKGDKGNDIVVDASRNFYVTGDSFRGMKFEHSDYATVKFDTFGEIIWDERYDARRNGHDVATAITLDSKRDVYITGKSQYSLSKNGDALHYDFYTVKYMAGNRGRVVWGERFNNDLVNGDDEASAIAVDNLGNVYVTGRSEGRGTGFDYLTIKYDTNGKFQWAKRYNNLATNGHDEATSIAVDSVGNAYVTGRSQGSETGFDYVTIKYDTNDGHQLWLMRYNDDSENGDDEAAAIALDTLGNAYVTGRSQGSGTNYDYYTIKYDNDGNMVWRVRYNNSPLNGADEAVAIAIFEDESGYVHVYVTGKSEGNETGFDYATVKYKQ